MALSKKRTAAGISIFCFDSATAPRHPSMDYGNERSPDPRPEYYRRRGDIFGGLRLWRIIRRRSCFAPGICRVAPRSRRPSTTVREYFQFLQLSRANCAFANERRAMDSPPCLTMCPCVRFSLIKMSIGLTCASCSRRKSPEFVHLQTESVYRNARSRFYSAPECLVRML